MFLFLLVFTSSLAQADVDFQPYDLKLGFLARSYPVGVQAVGSLGSNLKLWGDTDVWKYGYIRGALNLATSAVVNRAGLEFQVFPISILGFSAGYDWGMRNYTPKYLNCSTFECNGRIDRRYLRANAVAASHGIIFSGWMKYEELKAFHTSKSFFDEVTLLVGKSEGERVLTFNPALLYTLDDVWKVGAISLYSHALDTGDFSHLYGPVVSWTVKNSNEEPRLNMVGGMGLNRSPVVHSGWSVFAVIQYTIEPSLSIADLGIRSLH